MKPPFGSTFAILALSLSATAQADLDFKPGRSLSEEAPFVGTGANPGGAASKGKLVRLIKTPMATNDGRLVSVYADSNNTSATVWEPKGGEHAPRDIFARYSDDGGTTWSAPVNVSNTADLYSSMTDWNGDGVASPYYGDSGKPTIFNSGNNIVVTWVDKYAPESSWTFGDVGQSSVQGVASYPDIAIFPNTHDVPYACVRAAVSHDGGATWAHGDLAQAPPLQLTFARRDAIQDVNKGSGARWVMTWQEDPQGLQTGEADGPGDGASGANVTQGTDIWYTWTSDLVNDPLALISNRTPLSNQSEYDMTTSNGFAHALTGDLKGGTNENHGCSRANLALVNDGGTFRTVSAYEETKGVPDILSGKTIQYHAFPFDQPFTDGSDMLRVGSAGTTLTPLLENSRRVRFVTQGPNGVDPAIAIFWKQGTGDQGAPSDILLKHATSFDEAAVAAAPSLNMSTNTPAATEADFLVSTSANPIEDSRAHRAVLRGPMLILGFSYTPNGPLARYTDLENYDFWIRRSVDGAASWSAPQNLTNLDKSVTVLEPRLVAPSKTGAENSAAFIAAWGSETNVYDGLEESVPVDINMVVTTDQGASFSPVVPVGTTLAAEFESQFRMNDDVSEVYAVWMEKRNGVTNANFARATERNPLHMKVMGAPANLGDFVYLTLNAPGYELVPYQVLLSFGFYPGIDLPFGNLPLNYDPLMHASLIGAAEFTGFSGVVSTDANASATIRVPSLPSVSGTQIYAAFITLPPNPADEPGISEVELFEVY